MTRAEKLLSSIDALYGAALDPKLWDAALGAVVETFGARGATFEVHGDEGWGRAYEQVKHLDSSRPNGRSLRARMVEVRSMTRLAGRAAVAALLLSLGFAPACTRGQRGSTMPYPETQQEYDRLVAAGNTAEANPGSSEAVIAYGEALVKASDALRVNMDGEEWKTRLSRSGELLGAVAANLNDERGSKALVLKGHLLILQTGRYDAPGLDEIYRQAFAKKATLDSGSAFVAILAEQNAQTPEAVAACGKTYEIAIAEQLEQERLLRLLELCRRFVPRGQTLEAAYPDVTPETWQALERAIEERGRRRLEERRAEAEAPPAAPAPASGPAARAQEPASSAPRGPEHVSIRITSRCSKTVKVFFGRTPKFGSGTQSTISGNSTQNHSFKAGDMLWLLDDAGNGVGSATASAGMREIEIAPSCTAMSAR